MCISSDLAGCEFESEIFFNFWSQIQPPRARSGLKSSRGQDLDDIEFKEHMKNLFAEHFKWVLGSALNCYRFPLNLAVLPPHPANLSLQTALQSAFFPFASHRSNICVVKIGFLPSFLSDVFFQIRPSCSVPPAFQTKRQAAKQLHTFQIRFYPCII